MFVLPSGCYCSCEIKTAFYLSFKNKANQPIELTKLSISINGGEFRTEFERNSCKDENPSRLTIPYCDKPLGTKYRVFGEPAIYSVIAESNGRIVKKLIHITSNPGGQYMFIYPCDSAIRDIELIFD